MTIACALVLLGAHLLTIRRGSPSSYTLDSRSNYTWGGICWRDFTWRRLPWPCTFSPPALPISLIAAGALAGALALLVFHPENPFSTAINVFVGLSLLTAAAVAWVALTRGGLPAGAGAPPEHRRLRPTLAQRFPAEWLVYLGIPVAIMIFVFLVSGFSFFDRGQAGHHAGSRLRHREPSGPP